MQTTNLKTLKHQREFILSRETHVGLVAGFGAGKSKAATIKTIVRKMEYPNINVAYYLPTYPLIKDIAFPNFEETLFECGIPYTLNKTDKEFDTPFGKIVLRSMDNPQTIVGYEVGYSLIDEADILPRDKMKDVFVKIVARNRKKLPDGSVNAVDMVSTPEGFGFMYDFFVRNKKKNRKMIKAKTADNPFLPSSYIETLLDIYTEEQLAAYLNGEFVNLTSGNVWRNFDREYNHSDRLIKKGDKLHVGLDFNITNMNAVINVIDGRTPIAVDEITGAYDTPDMIRVIKETFPNHSVIIYPDASGNQRKTSAGTTDIKLLKDAKFVVRSGKSNPFVRDRVNSMNVAFCDNAGVRSYFVNTNNCPKLTEALEQQTYKNGVPDKQGGFDHITEAAGYFIYINKRAKRTRAIV